MGLMNDWKTSPLTFPVTTQMALLPKIFLSSVAPTSADLLAVSAKETGDGWPANVVTRANQRRVSRESFFFGANGFSSVRPELDILGPSKPLSWATGFGAAVDLVAEGYVPAPSYYQERVYGVVPSLPDYYISGNYPPIHYTELDIAAGIARRLMDDESLVPISCSMRQIGGLGQDNGLVRVLGSSYRVLIDELPVSDGSTFAVSFHWMPTRADQWSTPVTVSYCTVIFARPESMMGIEGFVFAPIEASTWSFGAYDHMGYKMVCIGGKGTAGWGRIFDLCSANCTFSPPNSYSGTSAVLAVGNTHMELNRPVWVTVPGPTPVLPVLPFVSTLGDGPHSAGLYGSEFYHIGDPEFVDSFSFVGQTILSATGVSVASAEVFANWSGDRLVEMDTGSMSLTDISNMRGQIFKTHVCSNPIRGPISIDDLAIHSAMESAGLDIKTEILVDAKDGNPAITFGEGETRVNLADRRIYHAMLGKLEFSRMASTYVKATGIVDNWALVTPVDGAEAPISAVDALVLIIQGASFIDKTTILLNGAFPHIFEMTQADAMAKRDLLHKQNHFDEKLTFKEKRPDVRTLSNSQQTALMLVQYTHNRAQMSSFVVGAMVMAANARKRLL